jgi:predicted O-linked N-acetylglucosamine transferase (SPINDLY family)
MSGWSPHAEFLGCYHDVDVALDTFPYNGSLTTCEALWMGVPVVTWPGETFAGRHSLSLLSAAGVSDTIAGSTDHYVRIAVDLASDLDRLALLRRELRPRIAASPLCDGPRFARNLASVLRAVWTDWCATRPTS